jgi:flagellar hook-associated protein 3 FlgL
MIDTSRNMMYHIRNLNAESMRISYQMATGDKQKDGSEDSLLHADILRIEDRIRVTENLKTSIAKSQVMNAVSDSSIAEMKDLLDNIKQDILKGLNDGMDRTDKLALATNLRGVRENMLDLMNVRVDGEYVFSGSVTTKRTIAEDANYANNGKVTFEGDGFLRKVAVQPGSYRDRGVTGYEVGFYTASKAIVGETFSFTEGERIIDSEGHEWKLNPAEDKLQRYDFNGAVYHPPVEIDILTPSVPAVAIEADATQQATKRVFTTDGVLPSSITTSSGEVIDIKHLQFEAKHNYFDDLNIIINALEGYSTALDGTKMSVIDDALVDTSLRTGLGQTTKQFDASNVGHGELGGRNNVFNLAFEKIEAQLTHYGILMIDTNGADKTQLAVESKALELTYSSLYATIAKMNDMSLVNYIR